MLEPEESRPTRKDIEGAQKVLGPITPLIDESPIGFSPNGWIDIRDDPAMESILEHEAFVSMLSVHAEAVLARASLSDRERLVLEGRFGFRGERMSLKEMAGKIRRSESTVRRIEHVAVFKLSYPDQKPPSLH